MCIHIYMHIYAYTHIHAHNQIRVRARRVTLASAIGALTRGLPVSIGRAGIHGQPRARVVGRHVHEGDGVHR